MVIQSLERFFALAYRVAWREDIARKMGSCPEFVKWPARASSGIEHSLPQEIQLGPAIHLAFEQLQPVDMALRGAIAIGPRQRRFHCGIVLTQPLGKALQLTPGAGEHPRQLGIEPFGGPLPHHLCEGLRVRGQRREERIGLLDLEELGLLGLGTLLRTAEQAIRHLAGGHRRGRRWAGNRCRR